MPSLGVGPFGFLEPSSLRRLCHEEIVHCPPFPQVELSLCDGFPYLVTRVVPNLNHHLLLLAEGGRPLGHQRLNAPRLHDDGRILFHPGFAGLGHRCGRWTGDIGLSHPSSSFEHGRTARPTSPGPDGPRGGAHPTTLEDHDA